MQLILRILIGLSVAILSACNISESFGTDDGELVFATKVFEYTPAPGQFINNPITGGFNGVELTPQDACDYAERRLSQRSFISLGGFGGYIVVGFDEPIINSGEYDLAIAGNPFEGSSEPGIVWVMQDENGNGKPDDVWYELAGSEYGKQGVLSNYSVTYYRPSQPKQPIYWEDSLGESGEIAHIVAHPHGSYYPIWIEADSYTLKGSRLEPRTDFNGSIWVQRGFDWGYVDNENDTDIMHGSDAAAGLVFNRFRLCDAVNSKGKSVDLPHINFVKVQTALNSQSGGLGENSTEVFAFCGYKR